MKSKTLLPFSIFIILFPAALILVLGGCGKEKLCDPGSTQTCNCPGGTKGAQACNSDGTAWEKCEGCVDKKTTKTTEIINVPDPKLKKTPTKISEPKTTKTVITTEVNPTKQPTKIVIKNPCKDEGIQLGQVGNEQWCEKENEKGTRVKHGIYKKWHPTGKQSVEGEYTYGKKEGEWVFWHHNGHKEKKGTFANDKQIGKWIHWHTNGKISKQAKFENGIPCGKWKCSNNTGAKVDCDKKDRLVGFLAATNTICPCLECPPESELLVKEGEAMGNRVFCAKPDGTEHGAWISWHSNGKKQEQGAFKDGKRNGKFTNWYENGAKESEGEMMNDEPCGEWSCWKQSGEGESCLGMLGCETTGSGADCPFCY